MGKREIMFFLAYAFVLSRSAVCDNNLYTETSRNEKVVDTEGSEDAVADALVENSEDHEDPEDYIWGNGIDYANLLFDEYKL